MAGAATLTATVAGDSDDDNATVFNGTADASIASGTQAGAHITGGKYTGNFGSATVQKIAGGEFTASVKGKLLSTDSFGIIDDGKTYTVYTKGLTPSYEGKLGFDLDDQATISEGIADAVDAVANGESAPVTYAGEHKAADVQAALKSGKVGAVVTYDWYNAKTATEAQAADFKAIQDMAAGKKSVASSNAARVFTIAITNGESDASKLVTYGYVTSLGKGDRSKERAIEVGSQSVSYADSNGYAYAIATAGKAADLTAKVNAKDKTYEYYTTGTGIIAPYALSLAAVDNAAGKGEQAAEKATQGIDVAKKSKTVKLKGAKKTKKAASFNLGATAQTAVTTAKASGSSKITVKGGKVTLKKGVKKGTYKATVTINAAASDAYLAAAKTVTVKFVVKK